MSETSTHLSIPYIMPNQAQKHVTYNEGVASLDAVIHLRIDEHDVDAPPEGIEAGYRVCVGQDPTGVFTGQAGRIAVFVDNAWSFLDPREGWLAWFVEREQIFVFDGADWRNLGELNQTGLNFNDLERLGVNAQSDDVNRLAVASDGSLFTHNGSDHRLSLNKARENDTASLLFQTNFETLAEIGLTGGQSLCAKVSADGETWQTAWCAEPETGVMQMAGARSGKVRISSDSVVEILPPTSGGFLFVMLVADGFSRADYSGIFAFDSGESPALFELSSAPRATSLNNTILTGATGPDASLNVAAKAGAIMLESRFHAVRDFLYMFVC